MSEHERTDAERQRLVDDAARRANWKRWGTYLADRQWATVREDYSADGSVWGSFNHDQSRSRAYRWGEDGLLGISDRECRLCFSVALWNHKDTILKERLFGLTGWEGNHGEDVKEEYFHLDNTPTHSYAKALYKYPQCAFPYAKLVTENKKRGRDDPEYELADTGVFDRGAYFDVGIEYAKASPDDIYIRLTITNRAPARSRRNEIDVLPTLWFRNTWIWGCEHEGCTLKPRMDATDPRTIVTDHETLEPFRLEIGSDPDGNQPPILMTDNETETNRLYGYANYTRYTKDAFHRYVVNGETDAVSPRAWGTKAAAHYRLKVMPGQSTVLRLRLSPNSTEAMPVLDEGAFDALFDQRIGEADEFYGSVIPAKLNDEERNVARQGYAGLLWTKQFYHYVVDAWLKGDPASPKPPEARLTGRNHDWSHVFARDILSMPDGWEYPWFAAWDLAFHMIPFAQVDPEFAKRQLRRMLREWYMHPNGQIPAYEFAFSDVNPPVHAWAVWRVYKMTGERGKRDTEFLASCFQKLLINFTWWVNRKDPNGKHLFSGGFLGLDNIGLFDRSRPLPDGQHLHQADGTAWMAFYCGTMLAMALELAEHDPVYEDMASKFFEHFVSIVDAMNAIGGAGLWSEDDGFYYDRLDTTGAAGSIPLAIRSMVGIIPLFAVEIIDSERMDRLPGFKKRTEWFLRHRADIAKNISYLEPHKSGTGCDRYMLAIPSRERLERVLKYVFDEDEFLSPYGLRSLSKHHADEPFKLELGGEKHSVAYQPGESDTWMFGGNSNWRGPIWFPLNWLFIEALQRYHHFWGDEFTIEYPTGSGVHKTLLEVADDLAARLSRLFVPDEKGKRACHADAERWADDPAWSNLVLFHEYFHGDDGRGLGANHQTGWTALVTRCLDQLAKRR